MGIYVAVFTAVRARTFLLLLRRSATSGADTSDCRQLPRAGLQYRDCGAGIRGTGASGTDGRSRSSAAGNCADSVAGEDCRPRRVGGRADRVKKIVDGPLSLVVCRTGSSKD